GEMAILPSHAPLMTMLQPGEIIVRKAGVDSSIFVSGGFFELMNDKVTILADSAEHAEEIDLTRAEEAKKRAEERKELRTIPDFDLARAEAALRRSLMRLKAAERVKARRGR
ncbi:MAG: ATP synthase F1 subunit epsilon, partial [Chloroflexota bacterium]|nr:ATP synthase F1 subunit epsilon [Chloroflexota bacterium]